MNSPPLDRLADLLTNEAVLKTAIVALLLLVFLGWESWLPLHAETRGRWRHRGRNLLLAVGNSLLLAVLFASLTVGVADWATSNGVGLLPALGLNAVASALLACVLLDAWLYGWHRANHAVPFLWRFHRMHHSDDRMDATTATRFHPGELTISAVLRLGLIPLLGVSAWHLIVYDTLLLGVILFHHADISLGRADRWLRWLIVTPNMHKVHHSRLVPETNSNFASVLSVWDRLARSFRMRDDPAAIAFGLDEFADPYWQTLPGMLRTPLADPPPAASEPIGAKAKELLEVR